MNSAVATVALDRVAEGVVALDGDAVVEANPAARRLLDTDDLVGSNIVALPGALRDAIQEGAAGETVRIESPDRHLAVEVATLPDSSDPDRLVLLRDRTEYRRLERRLDSLVGNLSDVVTVLDAEARVRYQSPSVERVLGYGPEERVGERALEWVHPDDRERASAEFQRCVQESSYIPNIEYRFRHGDGSWVWIEARARNLLSDPAVEGVVVVSRDVTERKQKEQVLRRQNDRLEEFASVVSHDLRNPLSTLKGRLDLARETGGAEHFDAMDRSVDRMAALIDDLLTLARAGEEIGEESWMPLEAPVREAWRTVDPEEADLEVETDTLVRGDRTRLHQLFDNLLSNAVEHAGPAVTVRVDSHEDGFVVEDDGPGIPAGEREVVFTRGTSGSPDGTGFGLAIVEEIAGAHGWSVEATEGAEGGARFEFSGVDVRSPGEGTAS